jgi:hypothetical protein
LATDLRASPVGGWRFRVAWSTALLGVWKGMWLALQQPIRGRDDLQAGRIGLLQLGTAWL